MHLHMLLARSPLPVSFGQSSRIMMRFPYVSETYNHRSLLGFAFPLFGSQMFAKLGAGGGNSVSFAPSILSIFADLLASYSRV